MHLSLLLLFAVPAVLLLGILAKISVAVVRALSRRQVPRAATMLGLFTGLVAVAGVLSLAVVLDAALSHSSRAHTASHWYCAGIFLLVVALPALAIGLRIRAIRASTHPATSGPA